MLKGLTNTFKNNCNNVEVTYKEYVVLDGTTIPIKAELQDDSYENGNFIGTFILKQISFETEATYDFKGKEFTYYRSIDGESIKIGTFITTDLTINDTTEIVKVIGMDYGLKTQVEYTSSLDYASGNITLLDVWNECCTLSGLESGINGFTNCNFIVDSDQFTGTGATIRDVFKGIAMSSGTFVKVMNDDKVYLVFNEFTSEKEELEIDGSATIENGLKLEDLEIEGNTYQKTTTGKNLFNINGTYRTDQCTVSITNNTLTQTNTNVYARTSWGIDNLIIGQEYTLSYNFTNSSSCSIQPRIMNSTNATTIKNGTTTTTTSGTSTTTFTATETTHYIRLYSNTLNSVNTNTVIFYNIQLEKGSATEYEPYTNGVSPNPDYPQNVDTVTGRQEIDVVGKNLFDINKTMSYTNNASGSVSNDTLTVTTTSTSSSAATVVIPIPNSDSLLGKTVTLSGNMSTSGGYTRLILYGLASNGNPSNNLGYIETSGNLTITMPSSYPSNYTSFGLGFNSRRNSIGDVGSTSTYSNVMLELGSTASDYETFKGQSYEINLGKNLFSETSITAQFTYLIPCYIGETYTISFIGKANSRNRVFLRTYSDIEHSSSVADNVPIYVETAENNYSITLTSTINGYLFFVTATGISNYTFTNIQLEAGSQATTYSAYKTPIELCKIGDYQDRIYQDSGTWYIEKNIGKVVLNGSESWADRPNYTYADRFVLSNGTPNQKINIFNGYSNYFNVANQGTIPDTYPYIRSNNTQAVCNFSAKGTTTLAQFKTWLSTHNTTVYYVLATPTTTEITDSELIKQLEYIELLEGINNISVSSGDLSSPLKLSYYNNELDTIEDYVELEDKRDTHPWTCLRLGVSQIDGENIDYIDEDLVEKYGENWLILNDNPFAYNQLKRQELISNIFYQIKEFGYSAFTSKTSFKPYLTSGDIIQFKNRNGNLVKSILLRYNHNAEELQLESPSETSATINYIYPLSAVQMVKNTQIEVDKDKQQITSIVENVGLLQTSTSSNADNINNLTSLVNTQGEQIDSLGTRITQNVSEITASVSAIQEEISEGVSLVKTTSVTVDDNGLSVSTDTSKISTTMTNDTFKITDSGNVDLAYFGYDENEGISKAVMDNLTVENYFIAGVHRIETMQIDGEDRTGWFYIGG